MKPKVQFKPASSFSLHRNPVLGNMEDDIQWTVYPEILNPSLFSKHRRSIVKNGRYMIHMVTIWIESYEA